jgi:hypothetical protein
MFHSSRKYDPSCSSRIRILIFYPSRIPDQGVKKTPDIGSATLLFVQVGRIDFVCLLCVQSYSVWVAQ